MKGKRILALALTATMSLSALSLTARAAEEDGQALTRAQAAQQAVELAAQYGGAVSIQYALWEEGEITLSGQSGVYSKTEDRALTGDNLYGVGSVSKVYTAAAVMKLVEQGKLALDEPVATYLPDFKMADDRYRDITVRMLLNHASGLMGSTFRDGFLFDDPEEDAATQDLLERLSTQRLKADPGAFSVYCNDGFTLAELVVEAASGMDFTAFLHQSITGPAGLDHTFTPADEFDRDLLAKTYLGEETRALPTETLGVIGAGGIYASAADLAAFGGMLCDPGVLSQSSLDAMTRNESLEGLWPQGSENDALAYGLGWDSVAMYPFNQSGIQALVKGGDTQLYHAGLVVLPEYDMAVAVLSSGGLSPYNQAAGARILMDALAQRGVEVADDAALPQANPAQAPQALAAYAGVYGDSSGIAVISFGEDGNLTMAQPAILGGSTQTYQYYDDGSFRSENGILIKPVTEENGRDYLFLHAYSQVPGLVSLPTAAYAYERLPENPVSPEVQAAWDARAQKLYLLLNEKYTSQYYPISAVFGGLGGYEEAAGYVGTSKIVDGASAAGYVNIPGSAGRDLSDMVLLEQKGAEYLFFGDFIYMDSAAAGTLYTGPGAYSTIQNDGYARWYQVGAAAGKAVEVQIEGAGGFAVFNAEGALVAASWAYGDTSAVLPEGGWVVFAGDPGARFHLVVA